MKKFKTAISLIVAVAMLLFIPGINDLHVSAQEVPVEEVPPTTYVLKYIENNNCWRYQISGTGTWNDKADHRELYYMEQSIKDGDYIVVLDSPYDLNLTVPVSLGNITFNHSHCAVVTAKNVDYVYVLKDSIGVVNGDVQNAYVYDNAVASFNNNVNNLYLMGYNTNDQDVGVLGTVNYAELSVPAWNWIRGQYYSVREGKFSVSGGGVKTKPEDYSTTPPPAPPVEVVPVA